MGEYNKHYQGLQDVNAKVYAISVDSGENAKEVADAVSFPVAEGATKEDGDAVGAWYENDRKFIQPSEFLLDADGKVITASYSTGPIGRIDPQDVIKMIGFYESRK